MGKRAQDIRKCLYRCIQILTGFQIVLGFLWMLANLGGIQQFQETKELLEIADTMITDEYVGILYPCLIRAALAAEAVLPVPYYCFLYVLQLGAGFFSLYCILERLPHRVWAVLGIMSIPTVNQFYLAVLPQSLGASALLLCFFACRQGKWRKGAVCCLLAGLLIPEFFLFGGIAYLLEAGACFLRMRKGGGESKRILWESVACLLAVMLLAGGIGAAAVEPHSRGRMARTPAAMALHRFVWPNFSTTDYFWTEEVWDTFSEEDLIDISKYPDRVLTVFGPAIEDAYGVGHAQRVYRLMAERTFRVRTREIAADILNDFLLYSMPPIALVNNLKGTGVSLSGWNYGRMAERAPALTRLYVTYSGNVFPILLVLALCCRLSGNRKREGMFRRMGAKMLRPVGYSLLLILWYTFSAAGMQDYRNVIPVSVFLGIWICSL